MSFGVKSMRAQTVVIGSQEWMSNNLDVDRYTDGSKIQFAKTKEEWVRCNENKIGCYCYYDNEPAYGSMYGKLYNIYAIRRGLAPHCWRIANRNDFDKIVQYLGATAPVKMKSTHSWNNEWNGTNVSGFNGLAAGCRNPNGTFSYVGRKAFWWVGETDKPTGGVAKELFFYIDSGNLHNYDISSGFGFSVRCVRDMNRQPPEPCP